MSDLIQAGATNVTTMFQLRNVADGTDATGKTITDFDLTYTRSGATPAAKVDAIALAAANSAHADNKMIEVDSTDAPGLHRVDWPDAAFSDGAREVALTVKHTDIQTATLRMTINAPVNIVTASASGKLAIIKSFMDQNIHQVTPTDDSLYRRFFGERKTATGGSFEERSGVVSGNITKALNPDMGIIFTTMADAAPDIYYGPDLIGKVIINDDAGATAEKRNYLIVGGYFFTDDGATGTVTKVFGIAKTMGVTNGSGKTTGGAADATWTGTDANEVTATGNGWTFIVEALPGGDSDFPDSSNNLHLEVPVGISNVQSAIEEIMSSGPFSVADSNQMRHRLNIDGTQAVPSGASGGTGQLAGDNADLTLRSVVISAPDKVAVDIITTDAEGGGEAVRIRSSGNKDAVQIIGGINAGDTASGVSIKGGIAGGDALSIVALSAGKGISVTPGPTGIGMEIKGGSTSGDVMKLTATDGIGLHIIGAGSTNQGLLIDSLADHAMELSGSLTGLRIAGSGNNAAVEIIGTGNAPAVDITVPSGTGEGVKITGGIGKPGLSINGGDNATGNAGPGVEYVGGLSTGSNGNGGQGLLVKGGDKNGTGTAGNGATFIKFGGSETTGRDLDADEVGGTALTVGGIADAVWDEAMADHQGVASFGAAAQLERMGLDFDFTSFSSSGPVILYYDGAHTGTAKFWAQVFDASGGNPSNTSEVVFRNQLRSFADDAPT